MPGYVDLKDDDRALQLLRLLADGDVHSGEKLGNLLGISRAAVWKYLQHLIVLGIDVKSDKGRGYSISGGLSLLSAPSIKSLLDATAKPLVEEIDIFYQIESTNSHLMQKKSSSGCVCLSESQTGGRGRRGRHWFSPFAKNIYFSVGWEFEGGVAALEGLSLVVGLVIVKALATFGLSDILLKWPNDVLYNNKKLGGILIELAGDPAGNCKAIIGIGLNVEMNPEQVANSAIDQPWIDIKSIAEEVALVRVPSRNEIVAAILNQLMPMLKNYQQLGFEFYRGEWMRSMAFLEREVVLSHGVTNKFGVLRGVSSSGALCLLVGGQEELVHGGELSLRLLK